MSLDLACTVTLPAFEGPLDLLLYLVEKQELDIYSINVAAVAGQYLEHLRALSELDLDKASEFYLMAVRLLSIKARALLPGRGPDQAGRGPDSDDEARETLISELVEYRLCRRRAASLAEMASTQSGRFGRPPAEPAGHLEAGSDFGAAPPLSALVAAYDAACRRTRRRGPQVIAADVLTIRRRMFEVLSLLRRVRRTGFWAMCQSAGSRREIVVTFLALLELLRRRRIRVTQPELFGDLGIALVGRSQRSRLRAGRVSQ